MFLYVEASPQDLLSFLTADGDVGSDLLVTFYAEGTDRESCTGWYWVLVGEILKHLHGFRQFIARLSDGYIQDELLDLDATLNVIQLGSFLGHCKRFKDMKFSKFISPNN